jgi:hypothetical protein
MKHKYTDIHFIFNDGVPSLTSVKIDCYYIKYVYQVKKTLFFFGPI